MKTRNYHDPGFFKKEEQPIGEPMNSGPAHSVFQHCVVPRASGDFLNRARHRGSEALCEFGRMHS
jgi:hypothetical protein